MARKVPCSVCGELKWRTTPKPGWTPPKKQICRECRRANPSQKKPTVVALVCAVCEKPFTASSDRRRYCSRRCANTANNPMVRAPHDERTRRKARERDAPGLTGSQRIRLKRKWLNQGRACIYCGAQATTMDHVLPLVRGGTNHEGNLAPCCKRCNSSKAGWTVVEWRTGKRLPPMTQALPWAYISPRPRGTGQPKPPPQPPTYRVCTECGKGFTSAHGSKKTCSEGCSYKRVVRTSREHYHKSSEYRMATIQRAKQRKARLMTAGARSGSGQATLF